MFRSYGGVKFLCFLQQDKIVTLEWTTMWELAKNFTLSSFQRIARVYFMKLRSVHCRQAWIT
jgi:hypothetical protein